MSVIEGYPRPSKEALKAHRAETSLVESIVEASLIAGGGERGIARIVDFSHFISTNPSRRFQNQAATAKGIGYFEGRAARRIRSYDRRYGEDAVTRAVDRARRELVRELSVVTDAEAPRTKAEREAEKTQKRLGRYLVRRANTTSEASVLRASHYSRLVGMRPFWQAPERLEGDMTDGELRVARHISRIEARHGESLVDGAVADFREEIHHQRRAEALLFSPAAPFEAIPTEVPTTPPVEQVAVQ